MQPLVSCILYSFDVLPHFALNSWVFVFLGAAKGRLPSRSIETFATAFVPWFMLRFPTTCNLTFSLSSHSSEMELLVLAHVLYIFLSAFYLCSNSRSQVIVFLYHIDRRCRKFHR